MACVEFGNVTICAPRLDGWKRGILFCFNCKRRRLVLSEFRGWYGWSTMCLACGDEWSSDGEIMERPFMRGWRQKNIAGAKKRMKSYLDAGIPQGLDDYFQRLQAGLA